ncbi:MAG TPA: ATP-binding cassette domain-containing protein [Micromonosporaceae bacterium]|nr:ATP-binding cassette domain-containing protein [Micromonosporaceae bacterium]
MQPPAQRPAPSQPALLRLCEIVVYGPGARWRDARRRVLDEVSIDVPAGSVVAVVGPPGFGGTTLLRVAAGLVVPDSGRVYASGYDVTTDPPAERGVGLVPAGGGLLPQLTAEENIAYGLRLRDEASVLVRTRLDDTTELLELRSSLPLRPHELSAGQRLRTALARAVVTAPRVLLVDGTAGAAPADELLPMVRRLRREDGPAVLLCTNQAEVAGAADMTVTMAGGRVQRGDR